MPSLYYQNSEMSLKVFDAKVYDEDGNVLFKVNKKLVSWGANVSIEDADDKEVFHVKQTGSVLKPAFGAAHGFIVTKDGNDWGIVKKTSGSMASEKKVVATFIDVGEIEATGTGGWGTLECDLTREGKKIGTVEKSIKNFMNGYHFEFDDEEDKLAMAALGVCLDQMFHTYTY